jgi:ribose transport system substrate-binding protein
VFLIDREAAGKVGEDYVTFIGSDFVKQGERVGEWLAKETNGKAGLSSCREPQARPLQ